MPQDFPDDVFLRVYRAIRWLWRAEMECDNDPDARFIFYWIAFNAAYAQELPGETNRFNAFFKIAVCADTRSTIHNYAFSTIPDIIERLVSNKYVFKPFWDHHRNLSRLERRWEMESWEMDEWEINLNKDVKNTKSAMTRRDTTAVLTTVFRRLYTLRNQLVHGGATWNSSVNRDQVNDGANIMAYIVPVFIELMMDSPRKFNYGFPEYPVVGNRTGRPHLDDRWPVDRCVLPCRHPHSTQPHQSL